MTNWLGTRPNKWLERTMLGVTSLAVASAAPLARRSATPLGVTR
jgi:hypothetical protein